MTNVQCPMNDQIPSPNESDDRPLRPLAIAHSFIGHWGFFGHWSLIIGTGLPKRNGHAYEQPARFAVAKFEAVCRAVELLQSGPRIGYSDAFFRPGWIRDSIPIVPHLQEQL